MSLSLYISALFMASDPPAAALILAALILNLETSPRNLSQLILTFWASFMKLILSMVGSQQLSTAIPYIVLQTVQSPDPFMVGTTVPACQVSRYLRPSLVLSHMMA